MKAVTDHLHKHRHFFIAIICIACTLLGLLMLAVSQGMIYIDMLYYLQEPLKTTVLSIALIFTGAMATKYFFAEHKKERGSSGYGYR